MVLNFNILIVSIFKLFYVNICWKCMTRDVTEVCWKKTLLQAPDESILASSSIVKFYSSVRFVSNLQEAGTTSCTLENWFPRLVVILTPWSRSMTTWIPVCKVIQRSQRIYVQTGIRSALYKCFEKYRNVLVAVLTSHTRWMYIFVQRLCWNKDSELLLSEEEFGLFTRFILW